VPAPGSLELLIGDAGAELILIDSPGINPFRPADLGMLSRSLELSAALPVLALDAGTASADMAQTFAALGSTWLLATKVDLVAHRCA
jgi:flagellar biosynthesis protein FlhF